MKKNATAIKTPLASCTIAESALELDGFSIIEQCYLSTATEGDMYLNEHLLLFVLTGKIILTYGKEQYVVNENEMILLKKATVITYNKLPNQVNGTKHYSLLFSLKDELITSFLSTSEVAVSNNTIVSEVKSSVYPMNDFLISFAKSVKPYFEDNSKALPGLLRIKMMEMLYNIATIDQNLFYQILQLHKPIPTDLREVVEQNYATSANISDLAYLSGKSLSSFKREFQKMYNRPPATYIREKRLMKAKELIEKTPLSIADVCYTLGFVNMSHFSKIFKAFHGKAPSSYRN